MSNADTTTDRNEREWEAEVIFDPQDPRSAGELVHGTLDKVIDRVAVLRIISPDCRTHIRSIA